MSVMYLKKSKAYLPGMVRERSTVLSLVLVFYYFSVLLEDPDNYGENETAWTKAKDMYESCVNMGKQMRYIKIITIVSLTTAVPRFLANKKIPPDMSEIKSSFCYFLTKTYVVCTQTIRLNETVSLSNQT